MCMVSNIDQDYCHQFLSILTEATVSIGPQKYTQNSNIHSIELDVYCLCCEAERIKYLFLNGERKSRNLFVNVSVRCEGTL